MSKEIVMYPKNVNKIQEIESGWRNFIWLSRVPSETDDRQWGANWVAPIKPQEENGGWAPGPWMVWMRHEWGTRYWVEDWAQWGRSPGSLLTPHSNHLPFSRSELYTPWKKEGREAWRRVEQALEPKMGIPWISACWMVRPLAHAPVLLLDAGGQAHISTILPPTPIQQKTEGLLFRESEQLQRVIRHLGGPPTKNQASHSVTLQWEKGKKQWSSLCIYSEVLISLLMPQLHYKLKPGMTRDPPGMCSLQQKQPEQGTEQTSGDEWIKKTWCIDRMDYYPGTRKEWNNAIYSNTDGPRDYHIKWGKS